MPSVARCLDGNVVKQDFAVEKKVKYVVLVEKIVFSSSLFLCPLSLIYLSPFASGNEN